MKLNTIDVEINKLTLDDIDEVINNIIYTKHWNKERGDYETPTQYNHRITWINNGYCKYKDLAKMNGSTVSYLEKLSSVVGWRNIKNDIKTLENYRETLEKEAKRKEANRTHLEIWEHNEKSIKFDLAFIGKEKKRISAKIKTTTDEIVLKRLKNELYGLSEWESRLRKDAREVQNAHRTALGQTNNYKDTAPDRVEMEQKGTLTVNNNITQLSDEERVKKYADYFERIDNPRQNDTGEPDM